MKLKEYLDENGIKNEFFAKKIGVTKSTLSTWINNKCFPRREKIILIEKETNGKVKAKDWFTETALTKGKQE